MQQSFENQDDELERIRLENEIKKIKLSLEHGMDLSEPNMDSNLPPQIESEFLDYIQQWEDQFATGKRIVINDLLGQATYLPSKDIPDDKMEAELDKIRELLFSHSIRIETLAGVNDRELYRFITEELVTEEIDDIRISGMTHNFIYEDFHPDHKYDINNRCKELVTSLFNTNSVSDMKGWEIADQVEVKGHIITKDELNELLMHFRNSFSSFVIKRFVLASVAVSDDSNSARSIYDIEYSGSIEGSADVLDAKAQFIFGLKRDYDWWTIDVLDLPGVL